MEVWDLYNENKVRTGKTMIRGDEIPDDLYHLVVHVWIKNNKNEYLISQRSSSRSSYPLYWECVGGSVVEGEDSLDGALRETKEEVGIDLDKTKGKIAYTELRKVYNGRKFNDIMDAWIFEYNGNVDLNKATTDEVCDVKWVTKEEIRDLLDKKKLVPTLQYFFENNI